MSSSDPLNPPMHDIFDMGWHREAGPYFDPLDGVLNFDAPLPDTAVLFEKMTEGTQTCVQSPGQSTPERTCSSPDPDRSSQAEQTEGLNHEVASPTDTAALFGETPEGAQSGAQSPDQSSSETIAPPPDPDSPKQTEQTEQTEGPDQASSEVAAETPSKASGSPVQPPPAQDATESAAEPTSRPGALVGIGGVRTNFATDSTVNSNTQQDATNVEPPVVQDILSLGLPIDGSFPPPLVSGSVSAADSALLNQLSEPVTTKSQGAGSLPPVLPGSTVSQPLAAPNPPGGSYTLLLNDDINPAHTMAQGNTQTLEDLTTDTLDPQAGLEGSVNPNANTQALSGLATDPLSKPGFDPMSFLKPNPYPEKPLLGNNAGLGLPAGTTLEAPAIDSSFVNPTFLRGYGAQPSAGPTAPNLADLIQGIDPSQNFPGEAAQGFSELDWFDPAMIATSGAQQTAASTAQKPIDLIQGIDPSITFTREVAQEAPELSPCPIDPAIFAEFAAKNGPMTPDAVPGGTAAAQPLPTSVPVPMPAMPGAMPNQTAPQTIPATTTGSYPLPIPAPVQRQRYQTTPPSNPQPARETIPGVQPSYPIVAGREELDPTEWPVLVHYRGTTNIPTSEVYQPLEASPETWGPPGFKDLFSYTQHGEWNPSLRLTRTDALFYITSAERYTKRPLKIWIQHCPAQRNYRYPSQASTKCRWDECPAINNTIQKGFYRVAFDERPCQSGTVTDPFHNAGYMHLHCFEKIFDIYELTNYGLASLDNRVFPYEDRNPMAALNGHPQLNKTYRDWCYVQGAAYSEWWQGRQEGKTGGRDIPREQKLWYVLTQRFIEMESSARVKMRESRNGNSLDKHLGDLDKYVADAEKRRVLERRAKKRVAEEIDNGDLPHEEDAPRAKRVRRGKRAAKKRVAEAIYSGEVTSDEETPPEKQVRGRNPAAKKRVAKDIDSEASSEDALRVKRVSRGNGTATPSSPAESLIIVGGSNEEEEEEESAEGSPVRETQAPAASPPPAKRPTPRTTRLQRKRKADREYENTPRAKIPWDATLREERRPGLRARSRMPTRRASS